MQPTRLTAGDLAIPDARERRRGRQRPFAGERLTPADLDCGSGVLAAAVLARHPAASGILVDFSEPMLAQARDHLGRPAADLRFVRADFGLKVWLDHVAGRAPFDVIVSGYAIHHQPDARKQELYGELFGLLRPGGLFVNVEHVASPTQRIETM